jgi:hypothetical protein
MFRPFSAILREASNKENYIKASYNIDVQYYI